MHVLIEKLIRMVGWHLIQDWASENLLPILVKWWVKRTDIKWDDKVYYFIMAIRNNEPTPEVNKKLEDLLSEISNASK